MFEVSNAISRIWTNTGTTFKHCTRQITPATRGPKGVSSAPSSSWLQTHIKSLSPSTSCQPSPGHPWSRTSAPKAGDGERQTHVGCRGDRQLVGHSWKQALLVTVLCLRNRSPGVTHAGVGTAMRGGGQTVAQNPTFRGTGMDWV